MTYHYDAQLKKVLECLKETQRVLRHQNTPDTAIAPEHTGTLRRAYLTALRAELLMLSSALDRWIAAGAQMEGTPAQSKHSGRTVG